jgi:hypothetical protein
LSWKDKRSARALTKVNFQVAHYDKPVRFPWAIGWDHYEKSELHFPGIAAATVRTSKHLGEKSSFVAGMKGRHH